ncbi:MAG: T9SS type A sorting domain-containing protein [Flavobacteriales bacterium]
MLRIVFTLSFTLFIIATLGQQPPMGGCIVTFDIQGSTVLCASQNVFVLPAGSPAGGSYSGSGVFDNLFFPSFAGPGLHTITYTVNDGNCQGAETDEIQVLAPTPIVLDGDTEICTGEATTITVLNMTDVEWSTNETAQSVTLSPAADNDYTVYGYDDNFCLNTLEFTVIVNALPVISISGNTDPCIDSEVILMANGASGYVWNDNSTAIEYIFIAQNNIQVCVTGTDNNGCTASTCEDIIVHNQPDVTISGVTEICLNEGTTLTASGAVQYDWSNGSFASTTNVNPIADEVVTVSGTDVYGCIGEASVAVVVNDLPTIYIDGDDNEGCIGWSIQLNAIATGEVIWSNNATGYIMSFAPEASQTITATVTDENDCSATAAFDITVYPLPDVQINGELNYCLGDIVQLMAMGAANYVWSGGSTQTTYTGVAVENEQVHLTGLDENGCSNEAMSNIEVMPLPEVYISGESVMCAGETTMFEAFGAESYEWQNGSNTNVINITINEPIEISVIGTGSNGCSSVAFWQVSTEPSLLNISGPYSGCQGDTLHLTATGGESYLWPDGSTDSLFDWVLSNDTTLLVSSVSIAGCNEQLSIDLVSTQVPMLIIAGDTIICQNETTTLEASGAISFEWNGIADCNPCLFDQSWEGNITLQGTDEWGCSGTTSFTLVVNELPIIAFQLSEDLICDNGAVLLLEASPAGGTFSGNGVEGNQFLPEALPPDEHIITYTYTDVNDCIVAAQDTITVDDCSLVDEGTVDLGFMPYPNPTHDNLHIPTTENVVVNQVILVDSRGRVVKHFDTNAMTSIIDVRDLSSGLYLIVVITENGKQSAAFIKE